MGVGVIPTPGGGDMSATDYDADNNLVVDDVDKVNGVPAATLTLDVSNNTAARHTQDTDQKLDGGGPKEVSVAEVRDHIDDTSSNPHGVTAGQVGAAPAVHTHTHASTTGQGPDDHHPKLHGADHGTGAPDAFPSSLLIEALIKRIRESGGADLLVGAIADGEVLTRLGTTIIGSTPGGGGDMLAATYDPTTVAGDAFDADNHVYNNGASGLAATDTQAAIDELADVVDGLDPDGGTATVATTNATETTLDILTLVDDTLYQITTRIVARRTDSADRGSMIRRVTAYRESGGGATIVGSVDTEYSEGNSNYLATFDVTGNDLRIRVTGIAANNVDWKSSTEVVKVA